MSFRERFDKAIKETESFAHKKIIPFINGKVKQTLKVEGIANIDFSKETGY